MYATLADIVDRAGEDEILAIADRDRDGVADPAVVAAAIAFAAQTIDSYVGVRYALPLAPVPAIVTAWSVSIARYVLHRDGAPDHVVRDYQGALQALRDAAAGRLALPDVAGIKADATAGAVRAESDPPAFTRERLVGWL
ncbi:gp436 family protein [Segnochrobactrum spirostomi]|uniref:DUF1320 domain-containing protein n=1 Tax=Segnochrobactrum spirostomi TaxID=2608987 RepID=A0A6A7Y3F4_9HYPH|nr:DUF1320 domain-containing protein [Segnochrobactrum spirostomi]MQT13644.1 DUF1320 domain-containing protein [Segnochrobactrum spirostomi]